jgi:hypothetical protein
MTSLHTILSPYVYWTSNSSILTSASRFARIQATGNFPCCSDCHGKELRIDADRELYQSAAGWLSSLVIEKRVCHNPTENLLDNGISLQCTRQYSDTEHTVPTSIIDRQCPCPSNKTSTLPWILGLGLIHHSVFLSFFVRLGNYFRKSILRVFFSLYSKSSVCFILLFG